MILACKDHKGEKPACKDQKGGRQGVGGHVTI